MTAKFRSHRYFPSDIVTVTTRSDELIEPYQKPVRGLILCVRARMAYPYYEYVVLRSDHGGKSVAHVCVESQLKPFSLVGTSEISRGFDRAAAVRVGMDVTAPHQEINAVWRVCEIATQLDPILLRGDLDFIYKSTISSVTFGFPSKGVALLVREAGGVYERLSVSYESLLPSLTSAIAAKVGWEAVASEEEVYYSQRNWKIIRPTYG